MWTEKKRAEPQTFRGRSMMFTITAKDLPRSVAWYTGVVGFVLDETFERDGKVVGVWVKGGDVRIGISQDDGMKGMDRHKAVGMRIHIATAQDVDMVAKAIMIRGGTIASGPRDYRGRRVFELVDPDGVQITIGSEQQQKPQ